MSNSIPNYFEYWKKNTLTVLVTFNRPDHTAQVLESLAKSKLLGDLLILCDAPRHEKDTVAVQQTRELAQWAEQRLSARVMYQSQNQGLAKSVLQGVNLAFEKYETVILLEDDCVPQEYFFHWMYECFERYQSQKQVFGISGYNTIIPDEIRHQYLFDAYFFPRMGSWGWGTWKDRWAKDNRNLAQLTLKCIQNQIDLSQGGSDIPDAIANVLNSKVKDTWTLPWLVNVYLNHGYYVYPTRSHINNIGLDGSGVHCGKTDKYDTIFQDSPPTRFPSEINVFPPIQNLFLSYQFHPNPISTKELKSLAEQKLNPKILHITCHEYGGAGMAAKRLYEGQKLAGMDSKMLFIQKHSNNPDFQAIGNIQEIEMHWNKIRQEYPCRDDLDFFTDSQSFVNLAQHPWVQAADIIHLHWTSGILNPAEINKSFYGKPIVWTLHDMNAFTGGCHYNWECRQFENHCHSCPQLASTQINDIAARTFEVKTMGYSGANLHLVSPSTWLFDEISKSKLLGHFPSYVIPNGFPLDRFKPQDKRQLKSKYGLNPDTPFILFGCQDFRSQRKGFPILLQALQILQQQMPNTYFCTFGHLPPELPTNLKLMSLGHLDNEEKVAEAYALADLFVIPSLQDNLPNVVVESLACGTPVVGFKIGGIPDMIQHQINGYLVDEMTPTALAEGIKWLAQNQNQMMQMRCRKFAEQRFDSWVQVNSYQTLYREILTQNPIKPLQKETAPQNSTITKMLNLGCGNRFHEQWINFDFHSYHPNVKSHNLRDGIPIDDSSVDFVYHSHVLEHFQPKEAEKFLWECKRVLRPGGIIRIVVPDLAGITREYLKQLEDAERGIALAAEKYDWMVLELLDQLVRNKSGGMMYENWMQSNNPIIPYIQERVGEEAGNYLKKIACGDEKPHVLPEPKSSQEIGDFRLGGEVHQWMYDRFSLRRLLEKLGFRQVQLKNADESYWTDFSKYLLDTNENGHRRKPDSLYMEAFK